MKYSLAIAVALLIGGRASAQTFTWQPNTTGNWSVGANWTGGVPPTPGNSTGLLFIAGEIDFSATNDMGPFTLRRIHFDGRINNATAIVSGAGSSLTFGGSSPLIEMVGAGPASISGGTLTVAGPLLIQDDSPSFDPGSLTISSPLMGSAGLTLQRAAGFLSPTAFEPIAAGSYSGLFNWARGSLSIGSDTALGSGQFHLFTSGIGLTSTGDFRASMPLTVTKVIRVGDNASLQVVTGSDMTLAGNIINSNTGPGGFSLGDGLTPGTPTVTMTGDNSYTGATKVLGGKLVLSGDGTNGRIGSSALTIGRNGAVDVGSTTTFNGGTRLGGIVNLDGGVLTLIGNSTAGNNVVQVVPILNVQAFGTLGVDRQVATSTRFIAPNLNRVNRGTLRVRGDGLGSLPLGIPNSASIEVLNVNGSPIASALVGGGGAAGTPTRSILPFAIGASTLTGLGDSLVTKDTNGLRPLDTTTEYASRLTPIVYGVPTTNYRLTQPAPAMNVPVTVNALLFAANGAGIYGLGGTTAPVTVTSGAVLSLVDAHTGPLAFGAVEGIVHSTGNSLILGPVTGANGLTIGGGSETVLTNTTGMSGNLTVNNGTVTLSTPSALSATLAATLNGGGISVHGFETSLGANVTVGDAGGFLQSRGAGGTTGTSSAVLTYSGVVSGTGIMAINGTGTGSQGGGGRVVLAGDNSGFAGTWQVNGGTLAVDVQSGLGSAPVVLDGGALAVTGATTISNRIVLTESSTLRADNTIALTGRIDSRHPSAGLTLTGGSISVQNAWTYAGPTQIGLGGSAPVLGATVTLEGDDGQIMRSSSLSINSGGLLRIDNSANTGSSIGSGRLGRMPVTLSDGRLELHGAASNLKTFESMDGLTFGGNTGNQIELRPFNANSSAPRIDFASLSRGAGSTLMMTVRRQDNTGLGEFGDGEAGRGVIRFMTPPTLTNGILAHSFGEFQTDGAALYLKTALVTTATASGGSQVRIRPLSTSDPGVVLNAFSGTNSTSNVILNSVGTYTAGNQTINALMSDFATVIVPPAQTLTLGSGTLAFTNTGASIKRANLADPFGTLASPAGVDLSIAKPFRLDGNGVPGTVSFAVILAPGSGTVSFAGDGDVELFAPSPAIQRLNVHDGRFVLRTASAEVPFSSAMHLHVASGGVFVGQNQSITINTISGSGNITLPSVPMTVGAANGSSVFTGTFTSPASGMLVKAGTGTLRLTNPFSTNNVPLQVNGGTLAFGSNSTVVPPTPRVLGSGIELNNGTTLSIDNVTSFERPLIIHGNVDLNTTQIATSATLTGAINLVSNATLTVAAPNGGGFSFTGGFTGAGAFVVESGMTAFNAFSAHTGGTTLQSSQQTLFGASRPFGTTPLTLAGSTFLLPSGDNRTINSPTTLTGTVTFGPASNSEALSTGFDLSFENAVLLAGAGNRTVSVTGTGNFSFTNVTGTAANGLTKTGGGRLTLAGTNSYAGPTAIDAGNLHIAGTKTGLGVITVGTATATAAPGVLSGSGPVSGAITVRATGVVAPGTSSGILVVNNGITFENGSTYLWELAANTVSTPGTNYDQINPGISPTVVQSGAKLVPNFIGMATVPDTSTLFWQSSRIWTVINAQSAATGSPFLVDNTAWLSAGAFSTQLGATGGVFLTWTPVPEPTHILAVMAGGLWLIRRWRRTNRGQ